MKKKTTEELVAEKPSLDEFKKWPRTPITLVVDGIRSLDNVGLLFRLSEAYRIKKIYLCGITGYPAVPNDDRAPHIIERQDRRINKTAIKTVPLVEWEHCENADEVVRERKEAGDKIVVLEQTDESKDYRKVDYVFPLTLVVGHERTGVSDVILGMADQVIEIPMYGIGNSHNVAISTAIVMSHLKNCEEMDLP